MTVDRGLGLPRTKVAGAVIAAFRSEVGWSQDETASRLGMDRSAFSRLETGRTALRIGDIFLLDDLLIDLGLAMDHGDLLHVTARALDALSNRDGDLGEPEMRRVVAGVVDRWLLDLRGESSRGQKAPLREGIQGRRNRGR